MNASLTVSETGHRVTGNDHNCPYCNNESSICAASLSEMEIDARRRSGYCNNENYDSCPIFLAKNLE